MSKMVQRRTSRLLWRRSQMAAKGNVPISKLETSFEGQLLVAKYVTMGCCHILTIH